MGTLLTILPEQKKSLQKALAGKVKSQKRLAKKQKGSANRRRL